jgi:hypothetical protein
MKAQHSITNQLFASLNWIGIVYIPSAYSALCVTTFTRPIPPPSAKHQVDTSVRATCYLHLRVYKFHVKALALPLVTFQQINVSTSYLKSRFDFFTTVMMKAQEFEILSRVDWLIFQFLCFISAWVFHLFTFHLMTLPATQTPYVEWKNV